MVRILEIRTSFGRVYGIEMYKNQRHTKRIEFEVEENDKKFVIHGNDIFKYEVMGAFHIEPNGFMYPVWNDCFYSMGECLEYRGEVTSLPPLVESFFGGVPPLKFGGTDNIHMLVSQYWGYPLFSVCQLMYMCIRVGGSSSGGVYILKNRMYFCFSREKYLVYEIIDESKLASIIAKIQLLDRE